MTSLLECYQPFQTLLGLLHKTPLPAPPPLTPALSGSNCSRFFQNYQHGGRSLSSSLGLSLEIPHPPCCRPPGGHTPPSRLRSPLPLHNSGRPPSPTWHHHRPAPSQDSSPPARLKLKVEGASQPFDAPQSWPDHLRRKLILAHTRATPRWDQAAGGSFRGDFPFSLISFALGLLAIKLLNTPFSLGLSITMK